MKEIMCKGNHFRAEKKGYKDTRHTTQDARQTEEVKMGKRGEVERGRFLLLVTPR